MNGGGGSVVVSIVFSVLYDIDDGGVVVDEMLRCLVHVTRHLKQTRKLERNLPRI